MAVIKGHAGWKTKDFKGMSFEQIEAKFNTVWKQIKDFIPMGSKEETERLKRKGLTLEQESAKKLKTSEEVPEEVKSSEEVPEEKVKEMMQRVPIEEVYVEALQVKHPIIDWKHLDREDLNQLWRLVKESLSISEESFHRQKKRDATAEKIALLLKSSSNCQSNSYDSYAKLVPDRRLSTLFKLEVEREKGVYPVGFKGKGKEKGLAELAGKASIFVDSYEPFTEDLWKHIKINETNFQGVMLCLRCKVSTNNQEDATQGGGPTETMMKFRSAKALELNTSTTRFNGHGTELDFWVVLLMREKRKQQMRNQ
nr:mitochondrial amidoxime reducing component 2-like [Tanacetum cinerariifolium]